MATKTSKGRKKNQQDGIKFAIIVVIALILLLAIYIISKASKENGNNEPAPSATPTTIVLLTETPTPEVKPTEPQKVTATPEPAAEPTGAVVVPTEAIPLTGVPVGTQVPFTPTPTIAPSVSESDAKAALEKKIDKNTYSLSLVNDHLNVDGTDFFMYAVYDKKSGKAFSSFVIVSKQSGKIYYYDNGSISDFGKFPPDDAVVKDPSQQTGKGITADQAYELLCTMDKDSLMLAKAPSEYTPEYDKDPLVNIEGKNCYQIYFIEVTNGKRVTRGEFFISEDGLDCYFFDYDTETFKPIPIG